MMRARTIVVLAALVVAVASMGTTCASGGKAQGPNVLLISIDTLRADALGAYGRTPSFTPNIDALAAEGVVFANARSNAPWTLPSHASLFTGLVPTRHRAIDDRVPINSDAPMLTEELKAAGYRTAAFVTHYYVGKDYGFGRGFDEFQLTEDAPADQITDQAAAWLRDKAKGGPFFLFVHYFDPHTPYTPPKSIRDKHLREGTQLQGDTADVLAIVHKKDPKNYDRNLAGLRALYDGEVEYVDQAVGRLLGRLDEKQRENTIVVLVSDHGEEFMEHGLMEHGFTLYDEQLRVPMIMRWPGVVPKGKAVGAAVSLVDVMPTILELAGRPVPSEISGGSVVPLMREKDMEGAKDLIGRDILAETTRQGPDRAALVRGKKKYIYTPTFLLSGIEFTRELFDLSVDPGEKTNILADNTEVGDDMLRGIVIAGDYQKRRQISLVFGGTEEKTKYFGTLTTNGSFISAYKDNVIYDTDDARQLVSREFGLQKDERKLGFLAFGQDGPNGVHFMTEPETAGVRLDLLVNDERRKDAITFGDEEYRSEAMPLDLPEDLLGVRRDPAAGQFAVWCRDVLVNKHVVTRAEVGDVVEMSPEMVAKLKSLGYVDEGSSIGKAKAAPAAPKSGEAPIPEEVNYRCMPLGVTLPD
ncbi:MAG: sulfatase [Deltaproteobacteria bacterium]|nr:sulfatase [Deltaproteobacteria bacterium]MCB9479038.1 sulfatase [Deltaproteobacteria bacterium]MCB9488100.1 sulfatase [Deltaproteobacteria bacterium]